MSSNKRGRSLADVVSAIDDDVSVEAQLAAPAVAAPAAATESTAPVAIVPINILVTPHDRKRLRQLSLDTGLSLQKLGHEAWNRLLETRGLPPLEPVAANVPSGRARRQAP
jgi:hypothetical protein